MDYRKCKTCQNIKPLNQFRKLIIKQKEYYEYKCKECNTKINKIKEQNYVNKRNDNIRDLRKYENKKCTKCLIEKQITDFNERVKRDYLVFTSRCKE